MLLKPRAVCAALSFLVAAGAAFGQCGVERWPVKTGTDPQAGQVNLNSPQTTTIAHLASLTAPSSLPQNARVAPTELTAFILNATLTLYKLESDSDYHLVLQDSSGNTMIAEIPSPSCVGSGSPFLAAITSARSKFNAKYTPTSSFQTANIPVQVLGVGFFDFLHGQTGVAPNGIELHTVLDIIFNPGTNPDFSLAVPGSLSVQAGKSGTAAATTTISGGFNSSIAVSASGFPSGASGSFNPASIPAPGNGSSMLTVTTGASTPAGTYPITITASGGGVTHTATLSLIVTAAGSPSFTVSATSPVTVTAGGSGTSTVTTAVSGGFNSAIALTLTGLPSQVTGSFSPASIPAPGAGSSTLTFTAGTAAAAGTYSVKVTGTGGGISHSSTVQLTITAGGGGGNIVVDPGFESATKSGQAAPGWSATSATGHNVILVNGSYPHTGHNYASLGGANNADDVLAQTLTIPATAAKATLTFWVNIVTQEHGSTPYDYLYADIYDQNGNYLGNALTLDNSYSASDGNSNGVYFQPVSADLSAYIGQKIQLVFEGTNDYELSTTFRVDDIAISVQ